MKKLFIDGKRFIDQTGAQIILNGINFVCKDKQLNYITSCDDKLFVWFKSLGFNVIRLGLIWDGVEPNPQKYDDDYLTKMKRFIELARDNDIYIFIDMHQDLYSYKYADGAPEWATITDGQPHVEGEIWSDAYLQSGAVMRAFDNFWNNTLAADGIGLQDHYAKMWAHVVAFYKDYDNIIGYDIMNEPCLGSLSQNVLSEIIAAYANKVLHIDNPSIEELSAMWMDSQKKEAIWADMSDMNTYKSIIEISGETSRQFDRDILTPFYQKVTDEIRSIDTQRFVFIETNYFSNIAIQSEVGKIDAAQVYAPHGYDLVVDTDKYYAYNQSRVDFIFDTHKKVQDILNTPVLIGEWGAFTNFDITYDLTINLVKIFEKYLWSNTFWCYYQGMEECKYISALNRAYPMSTSGTLLEYCYNFSDRTFKLSCENVINTAQTIIYYPNVADLSKDAITVEGVECKIAIQKLEIGNGGYIFITPEAISSKMEISISI